MAMNEYATFPKAASDSLVSYLGHSLVGYYSSAEMQSAYSTVSSEWALWFSKWDASEA